MLGNIDTMETIDKNITKLELVNQWIANVDTKSSFVLAFYGVIITIIFSSKIGNEMLEVFKYEKTTEYDNPSIWLFFKLLIVVLFFISVSIVFYSIYQTLKGRVNPKIYKQEGLKTNSNIFFGTIVSKSYLEFEAQSNSESKDAFLQDLNSQIYINSNIVDSKFKYYNKSLIWSIRSFIIFVLFMLIK